MPHFSPANAFHDRVEPYQRPSATPGKGSYKGLYERVSAHLAVQTANQQFEFDTAMWHGAITRPGSMWKAEMLRRLFRVLYGGGLMVQRGPHQWVTWASQGQPICGSISHGARVLMCLPEGEPEDDFWKWLWGAGIKPESRLIASHGVKPADQIVDICPPNQVMKTLVETKKGLSVSHFGINIALGGYAGINPISGKIITENGKHGHVYFAYYKGAPRKAILVNCEQSSPIDREVADKGRAGKLRNLTTGVPDQYGGHHTLGDHSRFAATGGDDFSYKSKKTGPAPTQLGAFGPALGHYYDGMYIDLTAARFAAVKAMEWRDAMIGESGMPPRPPGVGHPLAPVGYPKPPKPPGWPKPPKPTTPPPVKPPKPTTPPP